MAYGAVGLTTLFPTGIPGYTEPAPSGSQQIVLTTQPISVTQAPTQWPTPQPSGTVTRYTGTYTSGGAPQQVQQQTNVQATTATPTTGRLGLPKYQPVTAPAAPAAPVYTTAPTPTMTPDMERRRRMLRTAGIVAAAVVIGGIGYYAWRKRRR